jgi:hypothetical protein
MVDTRFDTSTADHSYHLINYNNVDTYHIKYLEDKSRKHPRDLRLGWQYPYNYLEEA